MARERSKQLVSANSIHDHRHVSKNVFFQYDVGSAPNMKTSPKHHSSQEVVVVQSSTPSPAPVDVPLPSSNNRNKTLEQHRPRTRRDRTRREQSPRTAKLPGRVAAAAAAVPPEVPRSAKLPGPRVAAAPAVPRPDSVLVPSALTTMERYDTAREFEPFTAAEFEHEFIEAYFGDLIFNSNSDSTTKYYGDISEVSRASENDWETPSCSSKGAIGELLSKVGGKE